MPDHRLHGPSYSPLREPYSQPRVTSDNDDVRHHIKHQIPAVGQFAIANPTAIVPFPGPLCGPFWPITANQSLQRAPELPALTAVERLGLSLT